MIGLLLTLLGAVLVFVVAQWLIKQFIEDAKTQKLIIAIVGLIILLVVLSRVFGVWGVWL